jgi:hypothetical protein
MRPPFPRRWKDHAYDNPIIRDYPREETTRYMVFGVNTRTVQVINAKTLSQMDTYEPTFPVSFRPA